MSCMKELYYAIEEAFEVPNNLLPEKYHNDKTGYVTLATINCKWAMKKTESDHQKRKKEKAKRIEIYRKQEEENGEIQYVDIDENELYRKQLLWAKYCPNIIEEEDPSTYRASKLHKQRKSPKTNYPVRRLERLNYASNL